METHLSIERLLEVASDDIEIFTFTEFSHFRDCRVCFATWSDFVRALQDASVPKGSQIPDRVPVEIPSPLLYKLGDKVRRMSMALDKTQRAAIGVVTFVMPSVTHISDFALYDVKFDFGWLTLYGLQLEAEAPPGR